MISLENNIAMGIGIKILRSTLVSNETADLSIKYYQWGTHGEVSKYVLYFR